MTRFILLFGAMSVLGACGPKQKPDPAGSAVTSDPLTPAPAPAPKVDNRATWEIVNGAAAILEKDDAQPAQIQRAITDLGTALQREPENATIRLNLGVAKHKLGDFQGAEREYQAAVGIDPSMGRAWLHLGQMALEQGKRQEAESTWRTGIRSAPADMDIRVALIDLLRSSGRLDDAITESKAALQENANSIEVYNAMGLCWQEKGDLVLARFVYQKALAGISGADANAFLHLNLGWTYYLDGRTPLAVTELERALELDPYLIPAMVNLSRIYMDDRNYADTIPLLERALSRAPDDAGVRMNLGIAYRGMGRYDDAEKEYRKVLELEPNNPAPHMNLGILFGDYTKDYGKSINAFEAYVKVGGPESARAEEYAAAVKKEKKRVEKRKKAEEERKKREKERAEQKRLLEEAEKKRKQEEKRKKMEEDPWGTGGGGDKKKDDAPAEEKKDESPWGEE